MASQTLGRPLRLGISPTSLPTKFALHLVLSPGAPCCTDESRPADRLTRLDTYPELSEMTRKSPMPPPIQPCRSFRCPVRTIPSPAAPHCLFPSMPRGPAAPLLLYLAQHGELSSSGPPAPAKSPREFPLPFQRLSLRISLQ